MSVVAPSRLYDALDERTVEILKLRQSGRRLRRRGWLVRRALLAADVVGLSVAFIVAQGLYAVHVQQTGTLNDAQEFAAFAVSLPLWIVAAQLYGLYNKDEERTDHSTTDDLHGVFHLVTVCTFALFAVTRETRVFNPQFSKLLVFWFLAVLAITFCRAGARSYCRRQLGYLQNTIILGAGQVGQEIARKLLKHPEYGINLVGFIDSNPREQIPGLEHLTLLGPPEDLTEYVSLLDVERVIVAFSSDHHEEQLDLIRGLNALDVQVDIVPRYFDVLSPYVEFHTVEGLPVCSLPPLHLSRSSRLIKRTLDLVGSTVGLVLLAPVLAAIAIAIKLDSPGPVFFRQVRMGTERRTFRIWKFRTMSLDAEQRKQEVAHLNKHLAPGGDSRMFKIRDDPRITPVGRFLRRTSLDELPQLFNVAVGEMSLVGPRPLILDEDKFVDDWARRRLEIRPGITGLWQVLGRDDIGFEEMVRLDYIYVTGWSLGKDISLLLRTLTVLGQRGS